MTASQTTKDHVHPRPLPRTVDLERPLDVHIKPKTLSDKVAYAFVRFLRFFADTFFSKRYGHRAVVLETVAAVPGMVGGLWQHLTALRKMRDDEGWIRTLLDVTALSAILKKRPSLATPLILKKSKKAVMKTSPPRKSRLITGSLPPMRVYRTSL